MFFYNVAPAPELCFFITWLRLRSGCALLIDFKNFSIPSVVLVAGERVIRWELSQIPPTLCYY